MPPALIEFKGQKIEYDEENSDTYRVVSVLQITKHLEKDKFILASLSDLHEIKIQIDYAIKRMEQLNTMRF